MSNEDIRARLAGVEPWQRSRFVNHPQYRHMSRNWQQQREEEERTLVRGPGVVGAPECNALFRVEGARPGDLEATLDFIAHAPTDIAELLAKLDAVVEEARKYDGLTLHDILAILEGE